MKMKRPKVIPIKSECYNILKIYVKPHVPPMVPPTVAPTSVRGPGGGMSTGLMNVDVAGLESVVTMVTYDIEVTICEPPLSEDVS